MDIKIIEAVERLNEEFIDKNPIMELEDDYFLDLCYHNIGFLEYVKYLNIIIWRSDEDLREFNEEKNEYEPIYDFLKTKIKKINKTIGKLKI